MENLEALECRFLRFTAYHHPFVLKNARDLKKILRKPVHHANMPRKTDRIRSKRTGCEYQSKDQL